MTRHNTSLVTQRDGLVVTLCLVAAAERRQTEQEGHARPKL